MLGDGNERPRLLGVELYFENLEKAKRFYHDVLGLQVADEQAGHHAKLDGGSGFICLEQKGAESYPSSDKAVLFLQVSDLASVIKQIGSERIVQSSAADGHGPAWAVLHDPEGHNVLLMQS